LLELKQVKMKLFFIRHGQSTNNLLWTENNSEDSRVEDPTLTPTGKQQANLAGVYIKDVLIPSEITLDSEHITLYCSLMIRAVETGCVISRELGQPIFAYPDIHEIGGIYLEDETQGEKIGLEGKQRSYFLENFPELVTPENWPGTGWWNKRFENRQMAYSRAKRVLNTLMQLHPDDAEVVFLVSHAGFYNAFIKTIIGIGEQNSIWFELNNVAISAMEITVNHHVLNFCNRFEYLPSELRT